MHKVKKLGVFCFLSIVAVAISTGCTYLTRATPTPTPQAGRDMVFEQATEKKLAAINPEAVAVFQEATKALDAGNYEASKALYNQVLSMAPGFATTYRRLGYIEMVNNNYDGAIDLYRKAMAIEPDGYTQSSLAYALIRRGNASDTPEAYQLASAAGKALPDDENTILIWLFVASDTQNDTYIRQADEQLLKIAPGNPFAHYYAGYLAGINGKWIKAENEFIYSKKLGMPADVVQKVLDSGISKFALRIRLLRGGAIGTGVWLLGLGILFLAGKSLSTATIRALKSSPPSLDTPVKPSESRIRSMYRRLISILSVYYYISMPFVILLLFVVIGAAVYIFGKIGSIPVQAIVILALMLFGSLFAILRSLFLRSKDVPPGRLLQRMDAPELWKLVEDVGRMVSVRPVDAIYLTPGTEIAVNEKGSIFKKLRGAGKRNLLLGMGVLPSLTQGQLAAILAHEYGHFSNKDTAGGNLAFQVRATLYGTIQGLIQTKSAYVFNPVWLFVVTYQRIFMRVTQGASRLQEILADRFAVKAYGSTNFIEGLQNLIRQEIAFPVRANLEIHNSQSNMQPVINYYTLSMPEDLSQQINVQYEQLMQRTTTEYDSHPAPKERIEWIEQLHAPYSPMQDNPRPALELFPNAEELQREMTEQINKSLKK